MRRLSLAVGVVSLALLAGCASTGATAAAPAAPRLDDPDVSGIQILGIRHSAKGYMLDFRYRVLDAEKALPLFERKTHPFVIHEASGTQLPVMSSGKTGPLRNSNLPREGRGYFIFFVNPGQLVQPGDDVTVVIGEFEAHHLTVQ